MRFFVSDVESGARASKFARFPPKTGSTRLPYSEFRFLPRKACEFQPAELVAACHRFVTTRFLGAKVRKTGPSSRAPSPQGFSRPDSPPRTRLNVRQPAEVVRQPAELVTTDVTAPQAPFFGAKSAPNGRVRGVRFSCRTASGMPKPPNSQVFGGKTTTLLSFPLSGRKSGEFQPAEHVTACHRRCHRSLTRQPAELVTTDAAPSGSVFWCKTVESEGFRVGLQVGSLQIRRFSVESGLQTSPLVTACHRFVTALFGARLRWVCKSWLILPVVICLSQSLKRSRARFLPGPPLIIHQWFMNGQGWFMNGQGWLRSRHVAEVSQAFFDRHFRSIHRIMPSGRFYRSLRHFAYR